MRSRRVQITLVLLVICALSVAFWLHRARPLSRAECSAEVQRLSVGCGVECSAKLARSTAAKAQLDYMNCNDECSARLARTIRECGR